MRCVDGWVAVRGWVGAWVGGWRWVCCVQCVVWRVACVVWRVLCAVCCVLCVVWRVLCVPHLSAAGEGLARAGPPVVMALHHVRVGRLLLEHRVDDVTRLALRLEVNLHLRGHRVRGLGS